ncbi:glycosyltransferase [Pseudomonas sp. B21-015]|uniref:glycosyltransferase n=1 Tax=Pseudomonas sp. B21-015 TaxID=2895473 RepID=UPI00215E7DB7|nr:glycosyltransferase [Pseudomonas sp. B21-015]UVM52149.1 glycosyltransferase [Pseudomonas sp. B21-015]
MITLLKALFKKRHIIAPNEFDVLLDGNPKGRNILIFTEQVNATYFISFDIPLREMHQRGEVNVAVVSQKLVSQKGAGCWEQWNDSFKPELVIFTRYGQPFGVDILKFFKALNVPVIYHIDDNLLELPPSLGAEIQKRQGAKDVIDARRNLLAQCDLIYASTPHLAELLKSLFPMQHVFTGEYFPYMGQRVTVNRQERQYQTIGYMGSKGHQEDLNLVVPVLERLLEERPELHFEVFGTIQMPDRLLRFGDRVKSHKVNKSYTEFLSVLAGLNWDIGLAPLVNEEFNLCKAPTKFLEYTAAGIPVVASNIPVYSMIIPEGAGVLVNEDWYSTLALYLDSEGARKRVVEIAQAYCSERYSLHKLEQQLTTIFDTVSVC